MLNSSFESSSSTGTVVTISSCIRWKIDNFSNINRHSQHSIHSPVFTLTDSQIQWCLKMYPNDTTVFPGSIIRLIICYHSPIAAIGTFELSILNVGNEKKFRVGDTIKILENSRKSEWDKQNDYFLTRRVVIEDPINRLLANDCLTISFDVTFHNPIVKLPITSESDTEYLKNDRLKDFDDFGKLLENGKFSDVKFVVGDKEICVHKAILASRSPVFDAMFQHEMQETKENVVEIGDIEYAVMKELFQFVYTGTVVDIENMACDLLVAAEKYCVERLKALCEKSLLTSLNVENALKYFTTADKCNANNLKKKILEFIVNHSSRVVEREEFDLLCADLVREITRAMARKMNTH